MCNNISNIFHHNSIITREDRNTQNRHKSFVVWFTGLSGSGKSTVAHGLEEYLHHKGYRVFVLDGDNVRFGLSSDLSFSVKDRKENIRRIGEVSKIMIDAGIIVLAAFISPYKEDRAFLRKLITNDDFVEIYCSSSLEVCESRDVKGLYQKARNGLIKNYTGVDSPYEAPDNPELVLYTEKETISESLQRVIYLLNNKVML
jgi:adenylylsulfate kinase